jgi:hypothetical protein
VAHIPHRNRVTGRRPTPSPNRHGVRPARPDRGAKPAPASRDDEKLLEQFHDGPELLPNAPTRCQRKSHLIRQE